MKPSFKLLFISLIDLFYRCDQCKTEIAMYDQEEVYHFFNVVASHTWVLITWQDLHTAFSLLKGLCQEIDFVFFYLNVKSPVLLRLTEDRCSFPFIRCSFKSIAKFTIFPKYTYNLQNYHFSNKAKKDRKNKISTKEKFPNLFWCRSVAKNVAESATKVFSTWFKNNEEYIQAN